MNGSLPEPTKHSMAEQVELQYLLLGGIESPAAELTPDDWAAIRQEVRERIASRNKRRVLETEE